MLKTDNFKYYAPSPPNVAIKLLWSISYLYKRKIQKLSHDNYQNLSVGQRGEYDIALAVIGYELYSRRLNTEDLSGRVLDFGCGYGGSSILLALQSKDVTANDSNQDRIGELIKTNLFPQEKIISGDGFEYMLQHTEPTYDLITAFGLGNNDTPLQFIEDFFTASERALKPTGKLLIESCPNTMDKVRKFLDVPPDPKYSLRVMIV